MPTHWEMRWGAALALSLMVTTAGDDRVVAQVHRTAPSARPHAGQPHPSHRHPQVQAPHRAIIPTPGGALALERIAVGPTRMWVPAGFRVVPRPGGHRFHIAPPVAVGTQVPSISYEHSIRMAPGRDLCAQWRRFFADGRIVWSAERRRVDWRTGCAVEIDFVLADEGRYRGMMLAVNGVELDGLRQLGGQVLLFDAPPDMYERTGTRQLAALAMLDDPAPAVVDAVREHRARPPGERQYAHPEARSRRTTTAPRGAAAGRHPSGPPARAQSAPPRPRRTQGAKTKRSYRDAYIHMKATEAAMNFALGHW